VGTQANRQLYKKKKNIEVKKDTTGGISNNFPTKHTCKPVSYLCGIYYFQFKLSQ
jgi:hypothetical protein